MNIQLPSNLCIHEAHWLMVAAVAGCCSILNKLDHSGNPPSAVLFESTANSFNWHSHGTVLPFVLSPPHAPILPSTATVLVLHPYFILKLLEVLIILFLQGYRIQQIIICGGAQISISLLYVLVVNNFLPASPEQRTRRRPAMQECVPAKSLYFFSILTVPVSIFLQFTEACFATPLD